uniref:Putative conserved plasma membrane protein n=1 Tax=Culex tarsalis TaxID=7177 RepID=A0A1Q3F8Z9_CULTA
MQRRSAARKSRQARLPDEMWELVFSYLLPRHLKTVRLVRQQWNTIVCSKPSLLSKLTLSIPAGCTAQKLQQMGTTRYSNVTVQNGTVETAPFLKNFTIRKLTLKLPWITAGALVGMLGGLPLVELSLHAARQFNYELFDSVPTGQMLTDLESLHLDLGDKDEFLRIFQSMCPKLARLRLNAVMKRYLGQHYGSKLLEFIRSNSDTLVELIFEGIDFCDESLLRDIIAIEGLELKHLSLLTCKARDYDIEELFEHQTSLTTLCLPLSCVICNSIFTGIGMYLQNLTALHLAVDFVDVVSVLSNIPRLRSLQMVYEGPPSEFLDLSSYENKQLHTLVLTNFYLDSITLLECLKKCPNIQKLWIKLCHMITVHDILVIAGQLEDLHDLAVRRHGGESCPDKFGEYSVSPFRKLRLLNVIREPSSKQLCTLLENCPVLYSLIVSSSLFTDAELSVLIKFMGNVTALCLTNLPNITALAAEKAVRQCPKMETLRICRCPNVSRFVPQRSTVSVAFE